MFTRSWLRSKFLLRRLTGHEPPRVAFLHIPKCGGTSINDHFKGNFGGARSGMSVLLDSMVGSSSNAATLKKARKAYFVAGHMGWDTFAEVSEGAIRFTVVRDPLERLKSLHRFARALRRTNHPVFVKTVSAAARMSFVEFCLSDDPGVRPLVDNAIARTLARNYYPFEAVDPTETTRAAVAHLESLDFVIEHKRLSAAMPRLAEATQTTLLPGRVWLNQTIHSPDDEISRTSFMSDARLQARIALDLDVYEHAQRLAL